MKSQAQLEFPQFKGEALTQLPDDLFIPPEALEIYLEDFSGPMDVLLYLIQKKDIDILDLDISEITSLGVIRSNFSTILVLSVW